jgi:hypothetical protein
MQHRRLRVRTERVRISLIYNRLITVRQFIRNVSSHYDLLPPPSRSRTLSMAAPGLVAILQQISTYDRLALRLCALQNNNYKRCSVGHGLTCL